MKPLKIGMLAVFVIGLTFTFAFAGGGNAEKGKAMFNDPKFAGGTVSCNSCHPNGKGLEMSGMHGKKEWKTPVAVITSLEDAVNVCIMMANKGKAIDPKSDDMKNLIAYIESLAKGHKHETMEKMKEKKEETIEKLKEQMPKKPAGY
ncbi:MAG: hypothetical protein HY758_04310 [Nitrospirae bacterium]|nr:hypothetical protein [Nitrospirota bacterium]